MLFPPSDRLLDSWPPESHGGHWGVESSLHQRKVNSGLVGHVFEIQLNYQKSLLKRCAVSAFLIQFGHFLVGGAGWADSDRRKTLFLSGPIFIEELSERACRFKAAGIASSSWHGHEEGFSCSLPPRLMHRLFCGGDVVWGRRGRSFSRAISVVGAHSSVLFIQHTGYKQQWKSCTWASRTQLPHHHRTRGQRTRWQPRL